MYVYADLAELVVHHHVAVGGGRVHVQRLGTCAARAQCLWSVWKVWAVLFNLFFF